MKIYLASRYSRREELCGYREELRTMGHQVQARWLDGKHQISDKGVPIGDHGEALVEGVDDGLTQVRNAQLRSHFASDDWQDVTSAELVINFTEPPRSSANRGGRHVEYGIALALGKRVIVVGHRENIFHWLPQVEFVETWEAAKAKCSNRSIGGQGSAVWACYARKEERVSKYTMRLLENGKVGVGVKEAFTSRLPIIGGISDGTEDFFKVLAVMLKRTEGVLDFEVGPLDFHIEAEVWLTEGATPIQGPDGTTLLTRAQAEEQFKQEQARRRNLFSLPVPKREESDAQGEGSGVLAGAVVPGVPDVAALNAAPDPATIGRDGDG